MFMIGQKKLLILHLYTISSVSDPDSIGSLNTDPDGKLDSDPVSGRQTANKKEKRNFMV
jgi:hypothetical protein